MRTLIYIALILLIGYTAYSQSLSVFNVDASAFPTIKANFYAFDESGNQITNLSNSDFNISENGLPRTVTNVSCPTPKPQQKVSIAMSIDVSGSMVYSNAGERPVELGKTTARALCKSVPMPPSEFALQTCDDKTLILQDFTTDRARLLSKIDAITPQGDNDFVEHLLNPLAGLLNIAKKGFYKKVAVQYTDAWWYALTDNELQAYKDTCSKYNIQFYAVIYSRPEAEPNGIKQSLQLLAEATGGYFYDGVTSTVAAEDIANRIQIQAQGGDPCQIEWQSGIICKADITNVEVKLIPNNLTSNTSYRSPINSITKLEFSPTSVKFKNAIPGINKDTTIRVTARNADFNVTNITSSNPAFAITPTNFVLTSGQSQNLNLSYLPTDSGFTYCKFSFENNICPAYFYTSGGFPGKKPKIQTLKLIQPNGGEFLAVGNDTLITWEGVIPEEKVKIEYSTDNGANWFLIANNAKGLSYKWRVPNTPSNQCLARVTTKIVYYEACPDVKIGNQIWMGCNLDVETYRDGTSIPEVTDPGEWTKLTTGAWCYYNNDPVLGKIYGKLYNWYAVNDPRGLAPIGWHIPSNNEWEELTNCLGGHDLAANKMKSKETDKYGIPYWNDKTYKFTNESGFTALPAGWQGSDGTSNHLGWVSYWWTSSVGSNSNYGYVTISAYSRALDIMFAYNKKLGYSVRCVKD